MKRPNSSGTVIKLSGKRRKPFAVVITDGIIIDENGKAKQKRKYVGYYEKRTEALQELEKYNTSPTEFVTSSPTSKKETFSDIYNLWLQDLSRKSKPLSKSTMNCYQAAYKNLSDLHNMVFEKLTVKDLEDVALKCSNMSASSVKNIGIVLGKMYKTAMRYGLVEKDLSELIILSSSGENARPHKIFTNEEIELLWANKSDFMARLLLILIYTGFRVRELLFMKTEDVHLEERYMTGGLKTAAGKNRNVPISKKILPLLDVSGKHLIELNGKELKYRYAYDLLAEYMQGLGMDHYFHDTRHTTATLLEKADVPLLHRKLILGHSSGDVTDRYTHVALDQLIADIDRI